MPIEDKKKDVIEQCITRLVKQNTETYQMIGGAIIGLFAGNIKKQIVSKLFDFDPKSDVPIEQLVVESLFNNLNR